MSSMPTDFMIMVPRSTDSTDSVREYIIKVLEISHGLSEESARHSALEWTSGNGEQLRKVRITQFRTTFGNRIARLFHKESRTRVLEEQYAASVPPTCEVRGAIRSNPGDPAQYIGRRS